MEPLKVVSTRGVNVDGEYVAACIYEPKDFSDIATGTVDFNASTTRGFNVSGGFVQELIPGEYPFSWSWRFMPQNVSMAFENTTDVEAYEFKVNFPGSGSNWAELEISL